jgi:sugar (pentulose or hexulose) kinase
VGLHRDFESAIAAMTRPGRSFEPQPAAQAIYERLYRDVYRHMYPRLRPLYQRIRELSSRAVSLRDAVRGDGN